MIFDSHSFSEFFVDNRHRFVHYANTYIGDPDAAQDIVVDAFMSFWQKHESLPDDTNVHGYILTSIRNKCIDYLHKRSRYLALHDNLSEIEEWDLSVRLSSLSEMESHDIFRQDIQNVVSDVMSSMPDRTRRVFSMSRVDNASREEIARDLGISVKGVEFHITKILKVLRARLKDFF